MIMSVSIACKSLLAHNRETNMYIRAFASCYLCWSTAVVLSQPCCQQWHSHKHLTSSHWELIKPGQLVFALWWILRPPVLNDAQAQHTQGLHLTERKKKEIWPVTNHLSLDRQYSNYNSCPWKCQTQCYLHTVNLFGFGLLKTHQG